MPKTLMLIIFFGWTLTGYAQGVEELDRRNGFKDIKLTSPVSSYEGLEYKKDIEDEVFVNSKVYVPKKGHYESIGTIKIHELEVMSYNDAIYKIRIITEKDPNLYKGLKKAFGEPEYALRSNKYFWGTDNLVLTYVSHSKSKIEMVYFSYVMSRQAKEDKKQVVEDIVDDF